MARFESSYSEFTERGAGLIVIAAQKIDGFAHAREHVHQHLYSFPVLFDEHRQVTRAWGVYHRLGLDAIHIARPATFVIAPDGKISWIAISPNQAERPATEEILAAIDEAKLHS